jgi:hypothetical protein
MVVISNITLSPSERGGKGYEGMSSDRLPSGPSHLYDFGKPTRVECSLDQGGTRPKAATLHRAATWGVAVQITEGERGDRLSGLRFG